MQKNGSFSREKSSNLDSVAIISLCVLGCGGQTATVDPFMPPESSAEPSVGLPWPTSCWASPPVTPFRASLLSSGFNDWSWAPWGHGLLCFLVSSWGAGGTDWKGVDFGIPLDTWEEPFKQFLALSFSEELFRETAGLFWMGAVLELETGFTLMGRRSIPEATRCSIRPPKISIAPEEAEERKIRTFTGFIGIPQLKIDLKKKQKWNAAVKCRTVRCTCMCHNDSYLAKHTDPEAAGWTVRGQRSNPFPNVRLHTPLPASFWSTTLWPRRRTDTTVRNPFLQRYMKVIVAVPIGGVTSTEF